MEKMDLHEDIVLKDREIDNLKNQLKDLEVK